jgi:acetolactate synthase-1/2/3 large subunit
MMQWFDAARRGRYLQPAAGGGMGYAISAALGAKLAEPGCPVIAVCGDGGFGMSMPALMTAVEQRIPIGIVILNNEALGWVYHGSATGNDHARLAAFDHVAIAQAMGCIANQPRSVEELQTSLLSAFETDTPYVIDVRVTLDTSFRQLKAL